MVKDKKETKLSHGVVTIGDYLTKLAEVKLPVEFKSRHHYAVAMIYSENKVVNVIDHKGVKMFVVEK